MGSKLCCCVQSTNSDDAADETDIQLQDIDDYEPYNFNRNVHRSQQHIRGDVIDFHHENCKNCEVENVGRNESNLSVCDGSDGRTESPFWVFGYGSLVWKVDFPIECSRSGYIKGFNRRFYQNSIDHRGTIDKPGRVVTLIPADDSESVFGMAYKIPADQTEQVLKHLDFREKNGYERRYVRFFPLDESEIGDAPTDPIVIYVATHDNVSFAGSTGGLSAIVEQISGAVGPSGTNREYVYQLADAMRRHFPDQNDEHLFGIEHLLREKEKNSTF